MDAFSRFEHAGWAEAGRATGYDRLLARITARVVDPLLDAARVGDGSRVLDLACGPGQAAARALDRGARPVGVDLSAAMIELARARHPAIEFHQAAAESLPFPAASFDAVVANFLLPHLADPSVAAAEAARVLASGGRLALSVWDLPSRARFVGILLDAITEAGASPPADLPPGQPFFRYAEPDAIFDLFHSAGFTEVSLTTATFDQQLSSVDELWHGLLDGTVRTSALVMAQPAPVQAEIRAAFERLAAPYDLSVPVAAVIAAGELSSGR
ncbi:class I SAM-dependent methyltransferase [Actinoplanes aureus]|uniref:Methyltransferase domain-containing protein n=1 Tax=Actinoplanes aureus TaxID=2792083 RepID=A0A931CAR0_9ACTN|nr:methyltransferase domain-containing protein [Actinoplanes aureus]MBG0563156.1 methyltransferase domain-containing protein [Actinoplanes aureus]